MSWLLSQLVAPAARPRRVFLPLGFSRTVNSDLVQVTWGWRVVASGPPLALARAIEKALYRLTTQVLERKTRPSSTTAPIKLERLG